MNGTNRALNRLLLAVAGLVLVGAAVLAVLATLGTDLVTPAADAVRSARDDVAGSAAIDATTLASGALLALAVLVIVLAGLFIGTHGGGRTGEIVRRTHDDGALQVDTEVARALLGDVLRRSPMFQHASVDAWRVRRETVLHVDVSVRRGTPHADARAAVDAAVTAFDAALGATLPVVVRIRSGFRARAARPARVV